MLSGCRSSMGMLGRLFFCCLQSLTALHGKASRFFHFLASIGFSLATQDTYCALVPPFGQMLRTFVNRPHIAVPTPDFSHILWFVVWTDIVPCFQKRTHLVVLALDMAPCVPLKSDTSCGLAECCAKKKPGHSVPALWGRFGYAVNRGVPCIASSLPWVSNRK